MTLEERNITDEKLLRNQTMFSIKLWSVLRNKEISAEDKVKQLKEIMVENSHIVRRILTEKLSS